MHDCKGDAEVTLKVRIKGLMSQFNSNYKSGIEVLEDEAENEVVHLLPADWKVEVLDVDIKNYELTDAEREVEHD